jgi:hypothetical protein
MKNGTPQLCPVRINSENALEGRFGGFVVEDPRVGLVKRWRRGFGVGDGLESRGSGTMLGGELDTAAGVKGIGERVGEGILEGE